MWCAAQFCTRRSTNAVLACDTGALPRTWRAAGRSRDADGGGTGCLLSGGGPTAVSNPLRSLANVCSRAASTRRARHYPAGAHTVAVAAARRLHCAARSGVASPNSLHSLRTWRSNNRDESEHEARWRAPTPALRNSSPPKSPPPGSACRDVQRLGASLQTPCADHRMRGGGATAASGPLRGFEARQSGPCPAPISARTSSASRCAQRPRCLPALRGSSRARGRPGSW
jgi:hypothetical protein